MAINGDISDLFFNRDFTGCAITDQHGHFVDWDEAKLVEEADQFLANLTRLNVAVPTRDDLLADFHARV